MNLSKLSDTFMICYSIESVETDAKRQWLITSEKDHQEKTD